MNEVMVYMAETSPKLLDYMPHIIAGLSVITTLIITVLQIINSARAYKKNSAYDVKKEAIYEALNFLDTYISWLDINSCSSITRQETDNIELTVSARNIHNKLCLTCDNEKLIDLYMDLICPPSNDEGGFPVFEYYDKFRNECRKELGFGKIKFSKDKSFIFTINTRALAETNNKEKKQ